MCAVGAISESLPDINKYNGQLEFFVELDLLKLLQQTLEPGGLFKHYDPHKVQPLKISFIVQMDTLSLIFINGSVYPRNCQTVKGNSRWISSQNVFPDCVWNMTLHRGKE